MAFEQKDLTGAVFTNQRKKDAAQPDYTGNALIAGVEYWASAWEKQDKNGNTYYSLAFTKKEPKPAQEAKPEAAAKPAAKKEHAPTGSKFDDMADDIPF